MLGECLLISSLPGKVLRTLVDIARLAQIYLFVCFVALRPKSTAMVIAGRSVHQTTLFPGQA